jgi:glutathione S-transferase
MKLYYVPGACSLADHIALVEANVPHQLVPVERTLAMDSKMAADGRDFLTINSKGYVPALELDDGTVLTENLAILVYIAELTGVLLAREGLARHRAIEAVAFMSSEIHGNFKPMFFPDSTPAEQDKGRRNLVRRFGTIAAQLGDREFLVGDTMTIADAYLYVMLTWARKNEIEIAATLRSYLTRMTAHPSVATALAREGLA